MIKEHDRIVLTSDLPGEGLKEGKAFEVEFLTLDGKTAGIATVPSSQVRSVSSQDITHARPTKLSV